MAGALYVSNPRRRRSRRSRRRNPATGGGWYAGGFDDLFDEKPARASVLAQDVARILEGRKPLTKAERQVAALQARAAAMQTKAARQARMAQAVADLEPEATLLAAREVALKRALRAAKGGSSSKRRKSSRKARKGSRRTRRSNPLVLANPMFGDLVLSNPRRRKRKGGKRRSYRRPPARNAKGRFVAKRRGSRRSRRNPLTIRNPMSGIPVIGTAVSMVGPALFGALGVEAIGQATKFARNYVTVPEMVQPFEFTIGGLLLAGVVQLITPIPAPIRHSLGIGLASAGGAVDWYRYRSESGAYGDLEFGDGGNWSVEYGDDEAFGDLELSGIDFAGDEDYCGLDFSMAEGEAAAEGYGAYAGRFPLKKHPRARAPHRRAKPGMKPHQVHHPAREGDRWHWLAQLVGPEDFKKIANMPPEHRLQVIAKCKEAAKAAVHGGGLAQQRAIAADNVDRGSLLPDPRSLAIPFANEQFAV